MVEPLPHKRLVVGSIPTTLTNFNREPCAPYFHMRFKCLVLMAFPDSSLIYLLW